MRAGSEGDKEWAEQDYTQVSNAFPGISSRLSNQDSLRSADSPYEDTPVPYLPLPSKSTEQTSPPSGAASQGTDTPSSSLPADTVPTSPRISGVVVLMGVVLGAILGGVVGHFTTGSLVMWACIGAVVGGVIALLPSLFTEEAVPWLLLEGLSIGLDDLFNCCLTSALLVVASVVTIVGLLLW